MPEMRHVEVYADTDGDVVILQTDGRGDDSVIVLSPEQAPVVAGWVVDAASAITAPHCPQPDADDQP